MATYSDDPILYMYTSLTAGSSHIVTATSRLETILRANRIPFKGLDVATDEKARMLWGRRAGKDESGRPRKLPGLVQMGLVVGDLVEIEDWNEYGELKQHVKIVPIDGFRAAPPAPPVKPSPSTTKQTIISTTASPAGVEPKEAEEGSELPGAQPTAFTAAMKSVGEAAAAKANEAKKAVVQTSQGVAKKVESVVMGMDGASEEKPSTEKPSMEKATTASSSSSVSTLSTGSAMQAQDGTWSHSSSSPVEDGPISSIIESMAALQSPTSGSWKNDPTV